MLLPPLILLITQIKFSMRYALCAMALTSPYVFPNNSDPQLPT